MIEQEIREIIDKLEKAYQTQYDSLSQQTKILRLKMDDLKNDIKDVNRLLEIRHRTLDQEKELEFYYDKLANMKFEA